MDSFSRVAFKSFRSSKSSLLTISSFSFFKDSNKPITLSANRSLSMFIVIDFMINNCVLQYLQKFVEFPVDFYFVKTIKVMNSPAGYLVCPGKFIRTEIKSEKFRIIF
ncbi:hypothetical protein SAMN05444280_12645 [Tangfeifania diversioriginum]|uniref:Uncharacterized protein n=1 Tax=Tangfeifania diversioriginum TaxID=1168035 RepID=A0A1M6LCL1_9BACT|nr:hypothetical protein SAMN05444280_12645 [Tangfeifania diversioriginum]